MKQPELGKKIVELRKIKCLTQEELVEKCNLNVRTLQRIESGEVTPRSSTIRIIFTALDYDFNYSSEIEQSKFSKTGFILIQRLEQVYRYLIDLFNLKTNTMKKVSIIFLFMLLTVSLAFNLKVHSQSDNNPLIGKWKLVGINKENFNIDNSTDLSIKTKVDNSSTRFYEFKSDLSFETRTIQNNIYNRGVYTVLNDSSFVTVHFKSDGKLATVSNLYKFKIQNDTLHFTGFYMGKASQFDENYNKKIFIDEWWVRLKDDK